MILPPTWRERKKENNEEIAQRGGSLSNELLPNRLQDRLSIAINNRRQEKEKNISLSAKEMFSGKFLLFFFVLFLTFSFLTRVLSTDICVIFGPRVGFETRRSSPL